MIRTALLAGIFLVLLSLAFSRSDPSLLPPLKEESVVAEQAVKHVAQAHTPKPAPKAETPVAEAPPVAEPVRKAVAQQPAPHVAPAPAVEETPLAPALAAPVVAQNVPQETHKSAGQPVSLLPPDMQRPQTAAAEPAHTAPVEPEAKQANAVTPAAPPAITPAAEIPTIPVAARTAAAPYDVPSGSAHVAVADPGAKPADAPKFMTPQERSKELYRLAREMEDTFIHKLAR